MLISRRDDTLFNLSSQTYTLYTQYTHVCMLPVNHTSLLQVIVNKASEVCSVRYVKLSVAPPLSK
jgi:hypothetical protein